CYNSKRANACYNSKRANACYNSKRANACYNSKRANACYNSKRSKCMRDDNISQEKAATENNSYITYFPSVLLEDSTLTDEELVTFLHFSKFLHRDGFTTASDKYLAEDRKSTRLNSSHVKIS